ncbi:MULTISPECIES: hypothetical protein [unclassified Streptomyces]|nr:hypothetical protein OG609_41610 [Streptomyces sp. NBC_01224]
MVLLIVVVVAGMVVRGAAQHLHDPAGTRVLLLRKMTAPQPPT